MRNKLLLALTLISFSSFSQKIGINLSATHTFYSMPAELKDPTFVPGVGIGLTYRKSFNDKSALVTGVDYQTFHYQVGRAETNQSGTTNSFFQRVINSMLQVPILYEYQFEMQKISPFVRLGLMLLTTHIGGTSSGVRSQTSGSGNLEGPSVGSVRLVSTRTDDRRTFGASPVLELGTFANLKGKQKMDFAIGVFPTFNVPEYSILYLFDDVPQGGVSPKNAIITQLKVRYYLK